MSNLAVGIALGSTMSSTASSEARKIACKGFVDTFDAHAATVQAAQQYASCVNYLYPAKPYDYTYAKIAVLSLLAFILIGAIIGHFRNSYALDAFEGAVMGAFTWGCLCLLTLAVGFLLYA